MSDKTQNNAKSSLETTTVEPGFTILRYRNETDSEQGFQHQVDTSYIQFHYGLKGTAKLVFNAGNYTLDLKDGTSFLLYNPTRVLPIEITTQPHTWTISVLISIKKFHSLFSRDSEHISFLSPDNRDKKYYQDGKIAPAMAVVLHQLMHYNLNDSIKELYFKGKAYELLSLYFHKPDDADVESCPFLVDEDNVRKIKQAKEIILDRMAEPPSLPELSEEIGLSLKKLKQGFKEIYGDTVYGYLLDHKLEHARQLLDSGQYNVTEVGMKIGYSTSSHFIAAFKKKFGTTPKKYLDSLRN